MRSVVLEVAEGGVQFVIVNAAGRDGAVGAADAVDVSVAQVFHAGGRR
jgi:hypothetical protein